MAEENRYVTRDKVSELLYGDDGLIEEFVEASQSSFNEFLQNYKTHLLARDEENLRKAGHKIKPVAQMLNVDPILEEYEHAKELLQDSSSPQEEIESSAERMESIVNQVLNDLKNLKS